MRAPTTAATERPSVAKLALSAIGVVFGDIGTSPLYAIHETFAGTHPLPLDRIHILGVLSLVFWSIMCLVSVKYVLIMMRADNRGEGGSLALLALLDREAGSRPRLLSWVGVLGIAATALFYGDSMITPAISVLSAVEGLGVVAPDLGHYVVPLTLIILVILFLAQRLGTAGVGNYFGPIITIWFIVLTVLGLHNIARDPSVLWALSPHHAVLFLFTNGATGFLALGAIVLVVTGAEALYADMGHFGRLPVRLAWYLVVLPALVLNYFGQGALLLSEPSAIDNPFFRMAPELFGVPLVFLATLATVIASQAVISGAFSVTRQAIQLGYLPRMEIVHTSAHEIGQVYIPVLNFVLMVCVLLLVVGFGSSTNLAAAYGVAVTGTMVIDTILIGLVMRLIWMWRRRIVGVLMAIFLVIDLSFFTANLPKIPDGGWFPLAVAVVVFVLLTSWKMGRRHVAERLDKEAISIPDFLPMLSERVTRVPGTAVFFTNLTEGVPSALLHNLKHNKVMHERVILLTVRADNVPFVPADARVDVKVYTEGMRRIVLHFGFMEETDVPRALANAKISDLGFFFEGSGISYFLSRETLLPNLRSGLPFWRQHLFAWMWRTAAPARNFFCLPINQVVEMGSHVDL